ncbi:MAG: hypothetical protein SF123_24490 [Chloroflexota bacterium]|nr:hypothetical protein [Chloroflexota bacterium]
MLALIILNLGLYGRLSSQVLPEPSVVTFPYSEDFSALSEPQYVEFGGDWEIRDQALVQLDTNGYDLSAFIPMEIPPEQGYQFDADVRFIGGTAGGGLFFNAQQPTSRQKSHMVRFNVDQDQLWLVYGYFGDDSNFVGQGSTLLSIAPGTTESQRLAVQVTGETYHILLNGTPQVSDIPLLYRGGAVGFITAASQVAFDNVIVEPLTSAAVTSSSPPPEVAASVGNGESALITLLSDGFDAPDLSETLWRPISGQWLLENGVFAQKQTAGFDLSSIFQQSFATPYTLRATLQHRANVGGGVLFGLPTLDNVRGGHMVRYIEDGSVVTWGYFDDTGAYVGQGSAEVDLPGTAAHTFEVSVGATLYSIRLDGVELATVVELYNPAPESAIGLTSSQSEVAFDSVEIQGVENVVNSATTSPVSEIDAAEATGDWRMDGASIVQTAAEPTDYIAGTGIAGEQFVISMDVLLSESSQDAGAGIIFHMSGRNQRALGSMVRFGAGGSQLFWGHYDANGVFIGEGGVELEARPGVTRTLRLVVRTGTYDIFVDEVLVAEALALNTSSGWIGLLSFSGPVEFSNIQLAVGG